MTVSAADGTAGGAGRPEKWLSAEQALKLAWTHFHAGRLEDAERIAKGLAGLKRIPIDALQILGLVAYRTGRAQEAAQHMQRAARGMPGNPSLHANLAEFRRASGDLPGAVQAARRAVEIDAKHPQGLNNLGVALLELGRHDEAEPHFRALLDLKPDHAEAWNNLGNLLAARGRFGEAAAAYDKAIALKPSYPEALANAGRMQGRQGRLDAAEALLRRSIAIQPRNPAARAALGRLRLLAGDAVEGWRESEWRLGLSGARPTGMPGRPWDGGPIGGRRILVHAEADLGETLLFARFLRPLLVRGPASLALMVPAPLRRLLQAAFPEIEIVAKPPAGTEVTAAIGSLPLLLGLADVAVPTPPASAAGSPYLAAPAERLDAWRARLPPSETRRVGLAWSAARPVTRLDDAALFPALTLALAEAGWEIVTLQTPPTGQGAGPHVEDLSPRLADLADTAAVVASLDAVMAADNAVAHLAGALGRPTIVLLPPNADWPWPVEGTVSPWYPSARLVRQGVQEEWRSFAARAASMLS